eukprot:731396_1
MLRNMRIMFRVSLILALLSLSFVYGATSCDPPGEADKVENANFLSAKDCEGKAICGFNCDLAGGKFHLVARGDKRNQYLKCVSGIWDSSEAAECLPKCLAPTDMA